ELLRDSPEAAVELLLAHVSDRHVVAGLGRDLRDAVAHQAAADNANVLDRHVASRLAAEIESGAYLMSEYVSVEDTGRVRQIVLDRPDKRNAINHDMVRELRDAARDAFDAAAIHCVVLRGEGRSFSAGIDVYQLGSLGGGAAMLRPFRRDCVELVNLLEE